MNMKCPTIVKLEFSERGKAAINEIRRIKELNQWLSSTLTVGTFANIFLGNGLIKSDYNLRQTDFDLFAKTLKSSPRIAVATIHNISGREAIRAKTSKTHILESGKQRM
jgi:hypothetical protein